MVACWIGAAYWSTSSTSFANPAITIARSLTDTFAGIRPIDMPAFIGAQLIGAISALGVGRVLFPARNPAAAVAAIQATPSPADEQDSEVLNV